MSDELGTVNSQVLDAAANILALSTGQSPAQAFGMLDAVLLETLGMAMYNAVNRQHSASMVNAAAVTRVCAKMLGVPLDLGPAPPAPPPSPAPSPDAALAAANSQAQVALNSLQSQAQQAQTTATQAQQDLQALSSKLQASQSSTPAATPPAPPAPPATTTPPTAPAQ
jgi:uncharacterized coiled-coil protein SlyX